MLVVGSVALDTVKTPFGEAKEALGGSATYASYAASFFTSVRMVGVVGEDFPQQHVQLLKDRGVQTEGLQVAKGRTFRWAGSYEYDLNEAHTLATELNVFETFRPQIPAAYKNTDYVFLANIDPELRKAGSARSSRKAETGRLRQHESLDQAEAAEIARGDEAR